MAIASKTLILLLIVPLLLLAGVVCLQIFLSRRERKWPGLVLPLLAFLYALVLALNVTASGGGFPWGPLLAALILGNVPTVVLLAIYWACREKQRVKAQMDKMNLDDLNDL